MSAAPLTRPLRRSGRARRDVAGWFLVLPLLAFLLVVFFYPMSTTVVRSLKPSHGAGLSLSQYVRLFDSASERGVMGLTFLLSVSSTVLSVALSVPLALVLRRKFTGRSLLEILMLIPAVVPGLVGALGLLFLYGQAGWFNLLLVQVLHVASQPVHINYTIPGLMIFYVWMFFPYGGLVILSGLQSIDPGVEEASTVMGATGFQTFRRVLLPLLKPSLWSGSILVFLQAFGAFSIPLIAGGNYQPLAVRIYTVATVFLKWHEASAMAVIMGVIQVLVLVLYGRLQGRSVAS